MQTLVVKYNSEMSYPLTQNTLISSKAQIFKFFQFAIRRLPKDKPVVFLHTGTSGAILVGLLQGYLMAKNKYFKYYVGNIRKKRENAHESGFTKRYSTDTDNYHVFIDDFIVTGQTLKRVSDVTYINEIWTIQEYGPTRATEAKRVVSAILPNLNKLIIAHQK